MDPGDFINNIGDETLKEKMEKKLEDKNGHGNSKEKKDEGTHSHGHGHLKPEDKKE